MVPTLWEHILGSGIFLQALFTLTMLACFIIVIINTLQHRNVDGLPATCAGSQTKKLNYLITKTNYLQS